MSDLENAKNYVHRNIDILWGICVTFRHGAKTSTMNNELNYLHGVRQWLYKLSNDEWGELVEWLNDCDAFDGEIHLFFKYLCEYYGLEHGYNAHYGD